MSSSFIIKSYAAITQLFNIIINEFGFKQRYFDKDIFEKFTIEKLNDNNINNIENYHVFELLENLNTFYKDDIENVSSFYIKEIKPRSKGFNYEYTPQSTKATSKTFIPDFVRVSESFIDDQSIC